MTDALNTSGQLLTKTDRVPFVFTSDKRLLEFANESRGDSNGTISPRTQVTPNDANVIIPYITMAVNPTSVSWKQGKRIVKRDTQEGSTYFHFTNSRGENNDILVLDFAGNAGNIDLRGSMPNTGTLDSGAYNKLIVWHNLWNLTRETMLLDDGSKNIFHIYYNSTAIPSGIDLRGFFSTNLEFTDSAEKPFTKEYRFSFTVQDTTPPLDKVINSIQDMFSRKTST